MVQENTMTLEDFFTLAELKNGLMVPARVEELVNVMQKESSCVVKNFVEVATQWSAVASVLAATENKDSLDQFIKLDGLQFLNNWLQQALNCGDSTSDCSVEESILALLGALDRLPLVQECSNSSIIMASVKDLFDHKSFRVQDKARSLFDCWNQGRETDIDNSNADKNRILYDKEAPASAKVVVETETAEQSSDETSLLRENGKGDIHVLESAGDEYPQSRLLDGSKIDTIQDGKISAADNHDSSCKMLIWSDNDLQSSQESLPVENESSIPSADETAYTEVFSVLVAREANPDPLTLVSVKEPVVPDHDGADKSDFSHKIFSGSDMDVVPSKVEHKMVDSNGLTCSENPVMHETTGKGGDDHGGSFPQNEEEQPCSKDCTPNTFSSLATESAQVAGNSGKCVLGIDLNEEGYHEGADCINTHISSIAASGFPDGYGAVSVEGSNYNSSKQRQDLLEIDLNMTEGDLDCVADTVMTDPIPASSCLLSGESSIEVDSRREGRYNLDLNSVGDVDCAPAVSSSSRQSLLTDFDLNENLYFINDTYDQQTCLGNLSCHNMNSCGELKRDDGVICIMGRRVEINGKDSAPSHSILTNGQSGISFMGNSLPKQLDFVGFPHAVASMPQLYGRTMFPTEPSTSLSAVCEQGYIPYMVDSRGVHVAPQIIGSPLAFPHVYTPNLFPMSLNCTPFIMNEVGSAKATFDLNSSSMTVDGWSGELGGGISGQNHLEESMGSTSQCLSSGLGMKRKEPDGGLELYPYNYKQQQLWR